jgi:septum formation protein
MLRRLSGRRHLVITGFVVVRPSGEIFREALVETEVAFRELTEAEIAAYVASGEPSDKAGAYAIQGGAGAFVRELRGSHSNVVGLPLEEVRRALIDAGIWQSGTSALGGER